MIRKVEHKNRRKVLISSLKNSGLTPEEFAARVLGRDRSTIYRWLKGSVKVPKAVETYLTTYWKGRNRE